MVFNIHFIYGMFFGSLFEINPRECHNYTCLLSFRKSYKKARLTVNKQNVFN
jgi:hypothetical protein